MADVQRIIDEVRFRLQSTDSEPTEELNRLAAEYADLCHDVNLRLRRCGEFLKRGLRAEAIHLAEAEPSLLENFALVDFPERCEWDQFSVMFRLPRAEPLLTDVAGELNEAYAQHAPLERLLGIHRLLALRRAPISQRLSVMRKLAEADPGFPFWDEDIRQFEKERVTEIGSEARAAIERGDGDALYALIGELTGPDWRQKPADSVIQGVRKLALESLADDLAAASAARGIDRARGLRDIWNKLSAEMRLAPADKLALRAAPALKWIAAEDSKSASSRRFHDRLLALEQRLADPQTSLAELDHARRDVLKSGRGVPEPMASQLYSRRVELARVMGTRRRQIIVAVTLAVAAIVTVVFLAVRSSGNTHAAMQFADEADQMISRGNLVQARELLRKSEGAARTDRQQEVEARLADAEKREESRIGEFRKAIQRARSAATREEADVSLQGADRLAVTLDERSTVDNLTAEWNMKSQQLTEHEESRFQEQLSEAIDLLDRLEDVHEKGARDNSFFDLLKSAERKVADLKNSAKHVKPSLSRHVTAAESRLARIRSALARGKEGERDMSDAQHVSGGQEYYIRFRGTVQGPYNAEKLKALRARGQFSRIHEVSTDCKSWSPASSIDDLFALPVRKLVSRSGPQPAVVAAADPAASASATVQTEGTSPKSAEPGGGAGLARAPGPADAVLWYYRIDDEQFGPTPTCELQKLIGEGRLGRTDIVWRDGLLDWLAVEEVPELTHGGLPPPVRKSSSSAKISHGKTLFRAIIALAIAIVAALVVYLAIVGKLRLSLSGTSPGPPKAVGSVAINSIDGADAERRLGECVGLVVTGVRATLADGTVTEQAHSTGTCFIIDNAGYALTNQHVVEGFQKQLRAELWREKVKREHLVNLEPKLWVFFDDKPVSAEIVDTIENFDVAVLKVAAPGKTYLRLSSQNEIPRGTRIAALGFPALDRKPLSEEEIVQRLTNKLFAKESIRGAFESRDLEYNRTDGTVSKVSKEQAGRFWIQHTARIGPGNSGGPLLTDDGVVWAINTLLFPAEKGQSETPLYYSLSVRQLKKEIDNRVKDVEWK